MKISNYSKEKNKVYMMRKSDVSPYIVGLSKYKYWLSEVKFYEDRIKYLRKLIENDRLTLKNSRFEVRNKITNNISGLEYMLANARAMCKIMKVRARKYEKFYNAIRKSVCVDQTSDNIDLIKEDASSADYITAHEFSWKHRKQLMQSKLCGCFFCLEIFAPDKIEYWIDNDNTALCPYCAIDSVIGDASGYPVTKEFLKEMKENWFF